MRLYVGKLVEILPGVPLPSSPYPSWDLLRNGDQMIIKLTDE